MATPSSDSFSLPVASLDWVLRLRALMPTPGLSPQSLTMTDGRNEFGSVLSMAQVNALSPIALAYIGDAVYELFVRGSLLHPPKRIQDYHQQVVAQVRAEQQAAWVEQLEPLLTTAEQAVLRRGRNASPRGPKRVDGAIYQRATGFETLIGYLYLTDPARLAEILHQIDVVSPSLPG